MQKAVNQLISAVSAASATAATAVKGINIVDNNNRALTAILYGNNRVLFIGRKKKKTFFQG